MLADGGDCLADLRAVGDQAALFGAVASSSTAFRVIDQIAATPGLLDELRVAQVSAREHVWALAGAPQRLTIDMDATLIGSHSEKQGAAGNFRGGSSWGCAWTPRAPATSFWTGVARAGSATRWAMT